MEAADQPPPVFHALAHAATDAIRYWEPRRLIYQRFAATVTRCIAMGVFRAPHAG